VRDEGRRGLLRRCVNRLSKLLDRSACVIRSDERNRFLDAALLLFVGIACCMFLLEQFCLFLIVGLCLFWIRLHLYRSCCPSCLPSADPFLKCLLSDFVEIAHLPP